MAISTEDLRRLLDGIRVPETSLSVSFQIAACRNKLEDAAEALAAELITARAKIEAAEKLAEAVTALLHHEIAHVGPFAGQKTTATRHALAAWEAAQ